MCNDPEILNSFEYNSFLLLKSEEYKEGLKEGFKCKFNRIKQKNYRSIK